MLLDRRLFAPADAGTGSAAAGADPAAAAAAAAAAAGAAGGKGNGAAGGDAGPFYKPWNLDQPTIDWIEGHKFGDPAALLKSARHFEGIARDKNAIAKPEKGKEKDWEGWELLGWEKDATKYTFDAAEMPKGMLYDQALDDELRKFAHDNRIPLETAREARKLILAGQKRAYDALLGDGAKAQSELKETLVKDWGADYQRNSELARRAMHALGVGLTESAELEAVIGAPRLVKLFHSIATKMGEQSLPAGGGSPGLGELSPERARAERLKLEGDKEWMKIFNDPRNPQHKGYVARRQQLIELESKGAHL